MLVVFHSDFTAELNTFKHTNLAVASVSMDIEAATGFLQKIPGEIFSSYQAPQQNTLSTCYCPPDPFSHFKTHSHCGLTSQNVCPALVWMAQGWI